MSRFSNKIIPAVILSLAVGFFFNFPNYRGLNLLLSNDQLHWGHILEKSQAPFENLDVEAYTHESKMAYRLTIPLFAKLFNIKDGLWLYIVQSILGIGFMIFIAMAIAETLPFITNKALIFFLCAFTCSYSGAAFFLNIFGWEDGYAFFLAGMLLIIKKPWIRAVLYPLAMFTDERAIVSCFFIEVFHNFYIPANINKKLRELLCNWPFVLGLMIYLLTRFSLYQYYGLTANLSGEYGIGLDVTSKNLSFIIPGWILGLEGLWLIYAFLIKSILHHNHIERRQATMIAVLVIAYLIACILVYDVSRSVAYVSFCIFPIIKFLTYIKVPDYKINSVLVYAGVISMVIPTVLTFRVWFWANPLILYFLREDPDFSLLSKHLNFYW